MNTFKIALASTALAGLAVSAAAQSEMTDYDNLIRTRDITGGTIYTMNPDDWNDSTEMYDAVGDNWEDIGEIEDIVLSKDGQMTGIVAEVGGFLDIGDKHVMIPVENIRLTAVDDETYVYVTRYSEEQLEELESVDEGWWD